MSRVTTLGEVFIPAADDVEDLDGPNRVVSVKIKPANRGLPHYAPRGGIISAGTSAVGTTQDNTGLPFGTGSVTIGIWVRKADWTPATFQRFVQKLSANLGFLVGLTTLGEIQVELGTGATTTVYKSSVAPLLDGAWVFIVVTLDRTGSASFYANGALLSATSIAAQSAQTLTNSGVLEWGANSAGATYYSGTFGECWIISGLLTATQIADIYRAGSIAPFCTWTLNSTTGQYVATIGGLSFFTWPDFTKGYGVIAPDRSGNNQHALLGTSGLMHAVTRNPPGVPQRAPRTALLGEGSAGSYIRSTLNTQNPGTGDFMLWTDVVAPSDISSTGRTLAALSSSTSDTFSARTFQIDYHSTYGLRVHLYGATTADERSLYSINLWTLLVGKRVVFAVRRSSAGVNVYVGVDGDWFEVTNLMTLLTAGSSTPAWTDQVDGQYLIGSYRSSSTSSSATHFDDRLANVAMTEAQLRTEYERGEPGPEWTRATNVGVLTGNNTSFDTGIGSWGQGGASHNWATLDANTTVAGKLYALAPASGDCYARVGSTYAPLARQRGRKFLMTGKVRLSAGTAVPLTAGCRDGSVADGGRFALPVATGTEQSFTGVFTVTELSEDLAIGIPSGANGSAYEFDDIQVYPLGYTARLRTDLGGGFQAPNDAVSATNDSTHFDLSTTGVDWAVKAPIGARIPIVRTFNHSAISTLPGSTLFGVLPPGWAVVDFQANVTNALDAGRTGSLGTSGSSGRWVNGLLLDTTGLKQAASLVTTPSSLTANTNIYLTKSASTTVGDIITANTILERKY